MRRLDSDVSLRQRALFLTGALVLAAILAIAAFGFARASNSNANLALKREAEALTNFNLAATNEAEAIANANLAGTREAEAASERETAQNEAIIRTTAEAEAAQQRDEAQASERSAQEAYSLSLAANARQLLEAEDRELALLLALAANSVDNPPLNSWRTLLDIAYAPGTRQKIEHDQTLHGLDVSHDGRYVAVGTLDGTVLIWDLETGDLVNQLDGHTNRTYATVFSPNDQFILSGSLDRSAILWNANNGEIIHSLSELPGRVTDVEFTPDGKKALLGINRQSSPSELVLWDLETGEELSRFGATEDGNKQGIESIAISPDGQQVLVGAGNNGQSNPHPLILWDIETKEVNRYLDEVVDWVNGVAISLDGKFGLAALDNNEVHYFDLESGNLIQQLQGHESGPLAVAFSPNGRTALSGGLDRTIIWWDLATGTILARFLGHDNVISDISFINETQAISSSEDGTIRIWDLTSRWQLDQWATISPENFSTATSLAISPDGRFALSGTNGNLLGSGELRELSPNEQPENGLMLWNYESGELLSSLYGHDNGINDIAVSSDGRWALTASFDSSMILWNLQNGNQIKRFTDHTGTVQAVDISSDGKYALSASIDNQIFYWDIQEEKILRRMIGHIDGRGVTGVAFLSNDQMAISASWDGSMIVWDLATGQQIKRLTDFKSEIGSHVFENIFDISTSPDKRHVLSAGNKQILLWDIESGKTIRQFIGHPSDIFDVEVNPNGQTALSINPDNGIILWDLATGKIIRQFYTKGVKVIISPDGETALSASADGSLIKWQLSEPTPPELMTWIQESRFIREFTCLERETYQIAPLCENGVSQESIDELLTSVEVATTALQTNTQTTLATNQVAELNLSLHEYPTYEATNGENRGELNRFQFDIWNYEGEAGEIINLHMWADNPIDNTTVAPYDRFEAGLLDPLLFIIAPDGTLLGKGDDSAGENGSIISDARISGIVLPEDGTYQIQARSYMDDLAGFYSLAIESLGVFTVDASILAEYAGQYFEGPWEFDVFYYVEDGKLKSFTEQTGETFILNPTSNSEFIVEGDGSIIVFTRDEFGQVDGYDIWISLIHPVGGQWYHAEKVDE